MNINANRLSDFQRTISFKDSSYLLISQKEATGNFYVSKKISKENVVAKFKDIIESSKFLSEFHFKGDWYVSGGLSNLPYSNLTDDSAATVEWCNRTLVPMINELSCQIYGTTNDKLKLPSYVGQIIISEKLTTSKLVEKIYGGKWQQIPGRFLLGVGPNDKNNNGTYGKCSSGEVNVITAKKMGGSFNVYLKSKNIPSHTHSLDGNNNCNYFPDSNDEITIDLHASSSSEVYLKNNIKPHQIKNKKKKRFGKIGGIIGAVTGTVAGPVGIITSGLGGYGIGSLISSGGSGGGHYYVHKDGFQPLGNILESPGDISKTFSYTPRVSSISYVGKGTLHDNMPKYISKYIWERVE